MKIISNTSPIIGLAKIGKLDLLKSLAEEVFIPRLVYRELLGKLGNETDAIELAVGGGRFATESLANLWICGILFADE